MENVQPSQAGDSKQPTPPVDSASTKTNAQPATAGDQSAKPEQKQTGNDADDDSDFDELDGTVHLLLHQTTYLPTEQY